MTRIADVLRQKSHGIATVPPETTVLEAARIMTSRGIGSVIVIEDGDVLAGIFTERDVLRRVVAEALDPAQTPVRDVMTARPLLTCSPAQSLDECRALMSARRIRHLPIVDGVRLVGMITSGDLLAWQLLDQRVTIQQLESFVFDNR
jgi:CBS domain-containing protein